MSGDEHRKVAAICNVCETVYAAIEKPDDVIRPIGYPDGCCDEFDFSVITGNEPTGSVNSDTD